MRCRVATALACASVIVAAQSGAQEHKLIIPAPLQGIVDKVSELRSAKDPLEQLQAPRCLTHLTGTTSKIERQLTDWLEDGKTPMVLVTAKDDRASLVAAENFYSAVRVLCREDEGHDHAFDVKGETSTSSTVKSQDVQRRRAVAAAPTYAFARLDFDTETHMAWRWWIWKVPVIVFVCGGEPYDLRYWKIAYNVPPSNAIIAAIPDRYWMKLPVWRSKIAPGQPRENVTVVLASVFGQMYRVLDPIPTWILTILGSILGSVLLKVLHRQ